MDRDSSKASDYNVESAVDTVGATPKKKRRVVKFALIAVGVLVLAVLATFIPTLSLETPGMQTYEGEYVTVYYESEAEAAKDVFELAETQSERIAHELGFTSPQNIKVYIYDTQSTFQTKKYGYLAVLLGPVLDLGFYVGDNRGTNVLLTSPANPGLEHDYDSVKYAVVHEMVHAYTSLFDNKLSYWMDNGLATYLAGQAPSEDLFYWDPEPSLEQTRTENPITFENIGGYQFSYTYVEYLDKTYGWDSVLAFAKSGDFVQAFGVDESAIYDGWVEFLRGNYV